MKNDCEKPCTLIPLEFLTDMGKNSNYEAIFVLNLRDRQFSRPWKELAMWKVQFLYVLERTFCAIVHNKTPKFPF